LAANQSGLVLIILSRIDYLFDKVFLDFILKNASFNYEKEQEKFRVFLSLLRIL
jgi:rod shape-determining protein mreD